MCHIKLQYQMSIIQFPSTSPYLKSVRFSFTALRVNFKFRDKSNTGQHDHHISDSGPEAIFCLLYIHHTWVHSTNTYKMRKPYAGDQLIPHK
jgi:hypothetical protein